MVRNSEGEETINGCIKTSRGPWLVHKTTKNGDVVTKFRYPTEKERQNNKRRERRRRSITTKIFAGLRAHGNYQLPKYADSNCLLMALCEEAGWHVDEEGNVHKKSEMPRNAVDLNNHGGKGEYDQSEDQEYCCICHEDVTGVVEVATNSQANTIIPMGFSHEEELNMNLGLSLS